MSFSNLVAVSSLIVKSLYDNQERHKTIELFKSQLRVMFAISDYNTQYYLKPIQVGENGKYDYIQITQIIVNLA